MKKRTANRLHLNDESVKDVAVTPEPTVSRDQRALKMFKRHLEGATHEQIAKEFGVSESTVSRAAHKDKWDNFRHRRMQRRQMRIFLEVEREERIQKKEVEPPGLDGAEETPEGWYWTETLTFKSGHCPLGPLPPDPHYCRIVMVNNEGGFAQIEYFRSRETVSRPRWLRDPVAPAPKEVEGVTS